MGPLYAQVERLVEQAGRQADTTISLYYFNAALYLLRVLKGNATDPACKTQKKEKAGPKPRAPEVSSPTHAWGRVAAQERAPPPHRAPRPGLTRALSCGPGYWRLGSKPCDPSLLVCTDFFPDQAQQSAHNPHVSQPLLSAPGEWGSAHPRGPHAPAWPRSPLTATPSLPGAL